MSGHSKWSKVKHQKAGTDEAKGAAFAKASRAITIAARQGGSRLRLAIEKARAVNMPKDTINRAIAKGSGGEVGALESVVYEAYGPGGSAIIIEAATENRQRAVSKVKNVLERGGGALTGPGSASYLFTRSETGFSPKEGSRISLTGDVAGQLQKLVDQLKEIDDVAEVYTNA